MSAIDSSTRALASGDDLGEVPIDEAHLAAAAFLARYRARTLEAYRYDLRVFFQWAADHRLYVHRPKAHKSHARGLDRSELGTFLFTAERYDHAHAALSVLLGLNGLRVSEACSTNIEDLAFDRGHWVLRVIGKGNKPAMIPLVPRTARTVDLAVGERHEGPIIRRHDGQRLDRRTAHR